MSKLAFVWYRGSGVLITCGSISCTALSTEKAKCLAPEGQRLVACPAPVVPERVLLHISLCLPNCLQSTVDKLIKKTNLALVVGSSSWREQFVSAVTVSAGESQPFVQRCGRPDPRAHGPGPLLICSRCRFNVIPNAPL